jgi:hypothetical protein
LTARYWINLNADYGYEFSRTADEDARKTDWDQLWIKMGLSPDYYAAKKVYLRFTAKLNFPLTTDDWDRWGSNFESSLSQLIRGVDVKYSGVGGEFSLAVGYKIE